MQDEWENEAQTKKKIWHAKDDGTLYRPKHDIDTRTCYMS